MRVNDRLEIPDEEVSFRFSRSGGAGGQNVNKRSTKAEALFDVANSPSLDDDARARLLTVLATKLDTDGVLHVVAQDARTQLENRETALDRMQAVLAEALAPPPKPRRPTRPSRGAKESRLQDKRVRSQRKRSRTKPETDD